VPNKPRTQHRSIRIDDPEWDDGEVAAEKMDTDRAKVINGLYRWWLRRPGAKLPERPPAELLDSEEFAAEVARRRESRHKKQ
jgi:hypothetical protein